MQNFFIMHIHIIRTPGDNNHEVFLGVKEILNNQQGDMKFYFDEKDISSSFDFLQFTDRTQTLSHHSPLTWEQLFHICNEYRRLEQISPSDFVILLTDRPNTLNWFSSYELDKRNIFIHTSDWELYIQAAAKFPVVYEVVANILSVLGKFDLQQLETFTHAQPIGCFGDFCMDKSQIILSLRTGDICPICFQRLMDAKVDNSLIQQALTIFEHIRKQMLFSQGFLRAQRPSKLHITRDYRIFLPDFANIEILLSPLPKTLYLFFLEHPEGLHYHQLSEYEARLRELYYDISSNNNLKRMAQNIARLCNPEDGSVREKCALIRSEIKRTVGTFNPRWVDTYAIVGKRSNPKTIPLDRKLVVAAYLL